MNKILFPVFLCQFLLNICLGQQIQSDSTFEQLSLRRAINFYNESLGSQAPLYNGKEYVNYDKFITGHQYFESDLLEDGSVMYDGILYPNVQLLYDIVLEEVVVEHFNKYYKIILPKQRVTHFSLLNHTFQWINTDSLQKPVLSTGFYENLYEGKVKLLAKRTKIMEESIDAGRVEKEFIQINRFFIAKDNAYYPVKNKKSVLKVFDEHKKEIRKYFRSLRINFKEDREAAIVKMTQHYDKIIQQ